MWWPAASHLDADRRAQSSVTALPVFHTFQIVVSVTLLHSAVRTGHLAVVHNGRVWGCLAELRSDIRL